MTEMHELESFEAIENLEVQIFDAGDKAEDGLAVPGGIQGEVEVMEVELHSTSVQEIDIQVRETAGLAKPDGGEEGHAGVPSELAVAGEIASRREMERWRHRQCQTEIESQIAATESMRAAAKAELEAQNAVACAGDGMEWEGLKEQEPDWKDMDDEEGGIDVMEEADEAVFATEREMTEWESLEEEA